MDQDLGLGLKGKTFFIVTKRVLLNGKNAVYTATVIDIIPNKEIPSNYTLYLKDKFGKIMMIERFDIKEIREE